MDGRQQSHQVAGRAFRGGGGEDGADAGGAGTTDGKQFGDARGDDAAEGEDGQWGGGAGGAQGVEADRCTVGGFGGCKPDWPEGDEVGPGAGGEENFLMVMGGNADQPFRTEEGAGLGNGEGVAAEMNAVGFRRQGDIEAVVDQQARAEFVSQFSQLPGQGEQFPRAEVFLPQLYGAYPAAEGGVHSGNQIAAGNLAAISDEVDAEIDRIRHG